MSSYDAIVVGSGPNGMCAAIRLAQEKKKVLLLERNDSLGGGLRSSELTVPGFVHDRCASILPMAQASPFLQSLNLERYGLKWINPPFAFGHPLDDTPQNAVLCEKNVESTAENLDECDRDNYIRIFSFLQQNFTSLIQDSMGPLRLPKHPVTLLKFAAWAQQSVHSFAQKNFKGSRAKALFAGAAAHSTLPFSAPFSAAIPLMLQGAAHQVNWPFPQGGAGALTHALKLKFLELGGEFQCNAEVKNILELPTQGPVLFDTSPRGMIRACGIELSSFYRRRLERFVHGPGIFKVDWALKSPIPWHDSRLLKTATVHLGGTLNEIAKSEADAWPLSAEKGGELSSEINENPYVLLTQPSLFDERRAPKGQHVAWAYVHVANGDCRSRTEIIENQVERFASGFKDVILAKQTINAAELESYNPNYVGGDVAGGAPLWNQIFTRPVAKTCPYSTSHKRIFLCSSSTPPGGGVHGMSGFFAANAALRSLK